MAVERTFAIIKPNAVKNGHIGEIILAAEREGFSVHGIRMAQLTPPLIRGFYLDHVEKPFFPELESFMMEGPVVLMVLEGEDCILRWRSLMGSTDPREAMPGTLRRKFGNDKTRNAVHGSDSPQTAWREVHFFFSAFELV